MIGKELGFDEQKCSELKRAALLHDIGKIAIEDSILNKMGTLTEQEYESVKRHTKVGADIVKNTTFIPGIKEGISYHHERYDGKGYPRRIAGEDIPLTARILCVADSFDAMTSKRCYKKAFPIEVAREKLLQDAGRQFDPDLVYKFVECLDNGSITLVKAEETVDNLKEML